MPSTTWAFYLSPIFKKTSRKAPILPLEKNFRVKIRMIICHGVILKLGPSASFIVISLPGIHGNNAFPD